VERGRIRHVARREGRRRQRPELHGAPNEQPFVRELVTFRDAPPDSPEEQRNRDEADQDCGGAHLHLLSNAAMPASPHPSRQTDVKARANPTCEKSAA